eukprot:8276740-Pyramimonas_sp.AAC.1
MTTVVVLVLVALVAIVVIAAANVDRASSWRSCPRALGRWQSRCSRGSDARMCGGPQQTGSGDRRGASLGGHAS